MKHKSLIFSILFHLFYLNLTWGQNNGRYESPLDSLIQLCHLENANDIKLDLFYKISEVSDPNSEKTRNKIIDRLNHNETLNYGEFYVVANKVFFYNLTGEWAKGLELATKGLEVAKKNIFQESKLLLKNSIAMSYQKQRNYQEAYYWSKQVIDEFVAGAPATLNNEWGAYMTSSLSMTHLGNTALALQYADKSIQSAYKNKIPEPYASYSYQRKGRAFGKLNMVDSAMNSFNKAIKKFKENNDAFSLQDVQRDIAEMYDEMNIVDSSKHYAEIAFKGASAINNPDVLMDVSRILYKVYDRIDRPRAYQYLKMYQSLKDSLFNKDKYNQIYQLESNEKQKRVEKEQQQINEKTKRKQNLLLAGGGLFGIFALGFSLLSIQKQKANKLLSIEKSNLEQAYTQLQSTQALLIQSEKMASLGELTAGIAHEIQNPLNFVNNFAEINNELIKELKEELAIGNWQLANGEIEATIDKLKNAIEVSNDIESNSEKINHHGKRAESIVKGMLQHSRKSTGTKEPADINALADEYMRLSYHGLRAKDKTFNAEFKMDLDPTLPLVKVIPQDIGRVLLNLFNNAFWAVNERNVEMVKRKSGEVYEPRVTISTKKTGDKVEIRVSDNGSGIPNEIKDKIFQPFFTTKPTGQGTGLGLSLAYDIIKAHSGIINMNSNKEGSTFQIMLPIQ